jgi:hypothetical protein
MACETDDDGDWRWNFGIYVYVENGLSRPRAPNSSDGTDEDNA